jgi:hypothetical protein
VTNSRMLERAQRRGRRDVTLRLEQPKNQSRGHASQRDEQRFEARAFRLARAHLIRSNGGATNAFVLLAGASTGARRVARIDSLDSADHECEPETSSCEHSCTANHSLGSEGIVTGRTSDTLGLALAARLIPRSYQAYMTRHRAGRIDPAGQADPGIGSLSSLRARANTADRAGARAGTRSARNQRAALGLHARSPLRKERASIVRR